METLFAFVNPHLPWYTCCLLMIALAGLVHAVCDLARTLCREKAPRRGDGELDVEV